jgi:hypothetical protein
MITTKPIDEAFMAGSLPRNPVPFLTRMKELAEIGQDGLESPQFRANLWIILSMTYGSGGLFTVDSYDEYCNLKKELL